MRKESKLKEDLFFGFYFQESEQCLNRLCFERDQILRVQYTTRFCEKVETFCLVITFVSQMDCAFSSKKINSEQVVVLGEILVLNSAYKLSFQESPDIKGKSPLLAKSGERSTMVNIRLFSEIEKKRPCKTSFLP